MFSVVQRLLLFALSSRYLLSTTKRLDSSSKACWNDEAGDLLVPVLLYLALPSSYLLSTALSCFPSVNSVYSVVQSLLLLKALEDWIPDQKTSGMTKVEVR